MNHRSKNSSRSSATGAYHSSLERQQGHRVSDSMERQHSASLERLHRSRTGIGLQGQLVAAGNSLERHLFGGSSQKRLRGGASVERQGGITAEDWGQGEGSRPPARPLEPDPRRSAKEGKDKKSKHQGGCERRVEELSRQLEEERQSGRRAVAKLQRDLARLKSERAHNQRDGREAVVKELERERMLRADTEQRLHDMRLDSQSCRARLHALQDEFRKMEEMVRDMLQYKAKIDQLKQEKASLAVTYENNLQKCRNHMSTLERENMMLLNQVKKMESQLHGKGDDRDKSRLLLERLKMVEAENSGLVLENEQQRQQYEKCLDQIANQVVQALLAQKTLREECLKLQSRVHDLELQNHHLNVMFQQRVRFPSDPTMQHMPYGGGSAYVCRAGTGAGEVTSAQFLQGSAVSLQSMFSEATVEDGPGHPQMSTPPPWLRDRLELPLDDETSLSSSATTSPSSPAHPSANQSPAGVPGQANGKTPSLRPSPSASSAPMAVPGGGVTTKIETEFPATNSSPKMKHISVYQGGTKSLERLGVGGQGSLSHSLGPARGSTGSVRSKVKVRRSSDTQAVNQMSEQAWQKLEAQVKGQRSKAGLKQSSSAEAVAQSSAQKLSSASSVSSTQRASPKCAKRSPTSATSAAEASGKKAADSGVSARKEKSGKAAPSTTKGGVGDKKRLSPGRGGSGGSNGSKLPSPSSLLGGVKLRNKGPGGSRDSSKSPARSAARNSMPASVPLPGQYYYDYSDEDSDSRPISRVYSCASTMSLSELLDTSGEGGDFALDDDFFSDWSSMCLSPQHRLPVHPSFPHAPSQSQGQATGGGGASAVGPPSSQAAGGSPGSLYRKLLSQGLGPQARVGIGGVKVGVAGVKAERDDSGCEVEPSQSDRSESSQANVPQGIELSEGGANRARNSGTGAVMSVPVGAVISTCSENLSKSSPPAKNSSLVASESSHGEDSAAVVRTVSVSTKSATEIQLPTPQAAVLINQSALRRSEGEVSPTVESAGSLSPESVSHTPSPSQPGGDDRRDLVSSSSSSGSKISSTSEMPFSSDLIASVISREAYGCTPKIRSNNALVTEEKNPACRPDRLILAPADKTFSVHGFTSSSASSCEDKALPSAPSVSPGKAKKSPPPVPHKPGKPPKVLTSTPQADVASTASASTSSGVSDVSGSSGSVSGSVAVSSGNGGGGCGGGKFPPETTLTVGFMKVESQPLDPAGCHPEMVRDLVNCLVKDMKERVARHSPWPITSPSRPAPSTTITNNTSNNSNNNTAPSKSLDSSFESLRAERSGSKDDGYSTMSSDIHPAAMDKYAFPESLVSKPGEGGCSGRKDSAQEPGRSESLKRRDKSLETSETDSAMETSAHSMDTRNSSQSLSSQVSSSSGENVLSPGAKVSRMARFFEDEVSKRSSKVAMTTTSPLSPGVGSPDSLGLSPNGGAVPSQSSLTSDSDGSSGQMFASVVSHSCPVPDSSPTGSSAVAGKGCGSVPPVSISVSSSSTSSSSSSSSSALSCSSVGQRIHDMVHNFQVGLSEKTSTTPSHNASLPFPPGPAHRPADLRPSPDRSRAAVRTTICDFRKYEINDPSKLNRSPSPALTFTTPPGKRDNVVSWPPRKMAPLLSPSATHAPHLTENGPYWEHCASPLQIVEDKLLDDIPEESSDEWENMCGRSGQDSTLHLSKDPGGVEGGPRGAQAGAGGCRCLRKAKSESCLSEKPRTASLYDEMMTGSWDSGKLLERSSSVSEMDYRSRTLCMEERSLLLRCFRRISIDENEINQRVAILLGKVDASEDSDNEAEAKKQLTTLWNTVTSHKPTTIPPWQPRRTVEALRKTCTPSPISVQKLDSGLNPDEWLLSFNQSDIAKHTARGSSALTSDPGNSLTLTGLEVKVGKGVSDEGEEGESSPRSPSLEQKLFHREFYSLCPGVESCRSLASSNCSVHEREAGETTNNPSSFQSRLKHPSQIMEGIPTREFDEISHQIASLSRTVDELNRSLNSLNSAGSCGGSTPDLADLERSGVSQGEEASAGGAWSASREECVEGYHWVEDEFYLTTCGGEVIIGSAAALADEELSELSEHGAGEAGGMFAGEDNDDNIADDAIDDFYCIRLPPRNPRPASHPRPVSGGSDSDLILNSLAQFRYNSDGQLSQQPPATVAMATGGVTLGIGWRAEGSGSHGSLSHVLRSSSRSRSYGDDNLLADKEHRANLLDSMLPSGGESNDSLSSDIGLDHMMCQRLMGRKGKMDVVRFSVPRQRPPLDPAQLFLRYGSAEQDAVAAFDFLDDLSTADSTENLPATDRRCRSASQPLSRDVVMRQSQVRMRQQALGVMGQGRPQLHPPRPLSESDYLKFRLPPRTQAEAEAYHRRSDCRYPSYHHYSPQPDPREAGGQGKGGLGMMRGEGPSKLGGEPRPDSAPPVRRQKVKRRRKKSDLKSRAQAKEAREDAGKGAKVATPPPSRSGKGSRGRQGGERLRKEWHDIKVGDAVVNTLSLSESYYDSSSSPSPPSLSYTDLSKF